MFLDSTTEKLQLITGSAGDIEVQRSYADVTGTPPVVTVAGDPLASITTAATTDIVAAPAASTQRKPKFLSIFNNHATVANLCTVQETDGTNIVVLWKGVLLPSEGVTYTDGVGWERYDNAGRKGRLSQKKFVQVQLTASAVTQYTVPTNTSSRLLEIIATNDDTVERTIVVNLVPNAGAAASANRIIADLPIAPKSTVILGFNAVMGSGDFISALASAATAVNLYISGEENI